MKRILGATPLAVAIFACGVASSLSTESQAGPGYGYPPVSTGTIPDGAVTNAKLADMATDRVKCRDTAGTGVPEDCTVGGGLEFTGSTGLQRSALSGDVVATAGSGTTTIQANAVALGTDTTGNYALGDAEGGAATDVACTGCVGSTDVSDGSVAFGDMANIATDSLIGRDTASSGVPESITLNATLSMDGSLHLQRAALTGDVTAPAGSNTTTVAAVGGVTPSANTLTMIDDTFAQWRTDLSLVIGTNVEAWSAALDSYAGVTPSANALTILAHTFAQIRTDLGLVIGTNVEAWDTDLDQYATGMREHDVVVYDSAQNITLTDVPSATTELIGTVAGRFVWNSTGYTQAALEVGNNGAGSANTSMGVKIAAGTLTDKGTFTCGTFQFLDGNALGDLGTHEPYVDLTGTAFTLAESDWMTITSLPASTGNWYCGAILTDDGNATADPVVRRIVVRFK